MQGLSLREHEIERQQLHKSNFDLKLKIFYLEEKLQKLDGNQQSDGQVESLLTHEVEERNLLLVKARNAIETLQAELAATKMRNANTEVEATRGVEYAREVIPNIVCVHTNGLSDAQNARLREIIAAKDQAHAQERMLKVPDQC
jgi:hypothetical protein